LIVWGCRVCRNSPLPVMTTGVDPTQDASWMTNQVLSESCSRAFTPPCLSSRGLEQPGCNAQTTLPASRFLHQQIVGPGPPDQVVY